MSNSSSSCPQFSDPYTARLVKLRNILTTQAKREALPQINSGLALGWSAPPPHPTFEEMMAVVNRPRRRRG
jgi:hypothetical protein